MRNRLSRLLDNTAEADALHGAEHGKNGPTKRHERTGNHLSAMLPHVLTFHALGYSFAPLAGDILMDDDEAAEHALSDVVSGIIMDHLRVPSFRESIRMLMLAHFREDWNRLIESHYLLSREQFLQYRRSLPQESLKGEYVKSFGEKLIADFLFEHGIEYNYEWNHGWGERAYRPDFTLPRAGSGGLIIEYFGMSGDSAYDQTSQKKRGYWQLNSGWELIEFTQHDIGAAGASAFKANLKQTLEAHGVSCVKRSEDQIWEDIKVRAIGRYTKAMVSFIGRCRKLSMSPARLRGIIDAYHSETEAESLFLELAHAFYLAYLEHLSQTGKTDFDGLIQFAAAAISADHTTFHRASGSGDVRALRYIFIDEFQDFSPLFHRLLCAIGRVNPNAELFCVGDDWQAINGFAGSDLKYFNQFQRYIGNCHRVHITTNYRSTRSVVDVGNALMHGKGQPAQPSPEAQQGTVLLADLSDFKPSPAELLEYKWDALTPMVLRLVGESLGKNSRVILLTRRTTIPRFSQTRGPEDSTLGKFADTLRRQFPKESRGNIHVVNTHKFKGGQGDTVIVMDALERSYPLVHPDWWFSRIFGESLEGIVDEERRLFYVALTRAVDKLIIVTEKQSASPFLNELEQIYRLKRIDWSLYPPIPRRTSQVIVTVGNQKQRGSEPTAVLKERLRAAQYDWFGAALPGWAKSFPAKGFSIAQLQEESWSQNADGVEVLVSDEFETLLGQFWINAGEWVTCFDKLETVCALQQEG